MFIVKSTGLRGPAYPDQTPYTSPEGVLSLSYPRELLEEIPEPATPEGYDPEFYIRSEIDVAPYVTYERRDEVEIIKIKNRRALQNIESIEERQSRLMKRMERERWLADAEKQALEDYGVNPDQLYALGSQPEGPQAAKSYVLLKNLDTEVKTERDKLQAVPEPVNETPAEESPVAP